LVQKTERMPEASARGRSHWGGRHLNGILRDMGEKKNRDKTAEHLERDEPVILMKGERAGRFWG